jgi:hypothetical protein
VPCQGEISRPRVLRVASDGSNRERWEIGDSCFDFANNGLAVDCRARIRLLATDQDGRTRVLHPSRPVSRRHLGKEYDATFISCSPVRRALMGVLGQLSESS